MVAESQAFDPAFWLAEWGVTVQSVSLGTRDLEAIAVWGDRGPSILVNDAPNEKTSQWNTDEHCISGF
jgi:hypothetical protein